MTAQEHTATKWTSQDSNPGRQVPQLLTGSTAFWISAPCIHTTETVLTAQCTEFSANANCLVPEVEYGKHDQYPSLAA